MIPKEISAKAMRPDAAVHAPLDHADADPRPDGAPPREIVAWAMYDFANSGYTTVVITAVFNAYFVASVAGNAPWATFAWTATLAIAYLINMVTAPAVGAWADLRAAKKRILLVTTVGCVVSTAALASVGPGDVALAVTLLVLSNFFFSTGENVAAAFLPELGRGEALGRISGWGWSLGYLGGLLSLGASLAYITAAQARGVPAAEFVPVTMLITAGIFAVAALPTFLVLRERARPQPAPPGHVVRESFRRLRRTVGEARRFRDLGRFLVCIVLYQAGVQTVVALAAVYAEQAMGFTTTETITLILLVNVAAAAGAFAFGHLQDRLGHVRTIGLTLVGWIVMIGLAWSATTRPAFWVAATLAGICLGSSQSGGRALVGYLAPASRHAEFFGLWGLAMKLGQTLGPLTYGLATWASGGDHRTAMLFTAVFFVAGLAVLLTVNAARGRDAALSAAA
jgi:UMF1 family MFS transporter